MRAWLTTFLACVLLAVVQTTLMPVLRLGAAMPDLFCVLIVHLGLQATRRRAGLLAAWVGLVAEQVTIMPFGVLTLAYVSAAIWVEATRHDVLRSSRGTYVLVSALVATGVHAFGMAYVACVTPRSPLDWSFAWPVLLLTAGGTALAAAVLGPWLLALRVGMTGEKTSLWRELTSR